MLEINNDCFLKPTEPEISNEVPPTRPLIDVYDDETADKDGLASVATCKVDGAKPPAKVTWHFENQGKIIIFFRASQTVFRQRSWRCDSKLTTSRLQRKTNADVEYSSNCPS